MSGGVFPTTSEMLKDFLNWGIRERRWVFLFYFILFFYFFIFFFIFIFFCFCFCSFVVCFSNL